MAHVAALRDLNKLNTFVRVAERRSFTRAAQDLRTTPSVVSKHMKELEDSLGISLLSRSTHGIVLTEAGDKLYRSCLEMLSSLDEQVIDVRNLQKAPAGTLRIWSAGGYSRHVLAPIVADFAALFPMLRVHVSVAPDDMIPSEDGSDVFIVRHKPAQPGLVEMDIGQIPHVVCASPEYLKLHGAPASPNDLKAHNCLLNPYANQKEWPFTSGDRQISVPVSGSLSSNSSAALVELALRHVGIVRAPLYDVRFDIERGALSPLFKAHTLSPERMYAYYSKAKFLPKKTTEFLRFLTEAGRGDPSHR